jgi:hypothetical protein
MNLTLEDFTSVTLQPYNNCRFNPVSLILIIEEGSTKLLYLKLNTTFRVDIGTFWNMYVLKSSWEFPDYK